MRTIKFRSYDDRKKEIWYPETVGRGYDTPNLMQFTGLLDKHGKEIYEGDIIGTDDVYSRTKMVVEYVESKFMGCNKMRPKEHQWLSDVNASYDLEFLLENPNKYEIIGNIYQNPELIKNNE